LRNGGLEEALIDYEMKEEAQPGGNVLGRSLGDMEDNVQGMPFTIVTMKPQAAKKKYDILV
jgi:hypothetical protein